MKASAVADAFLFKMVYGINFKQIVKKSVRVKSWYFCCLVYVNLNKFKYEKNATYSCIGYV